MADRIVVMRAGRLEQAGPPLELYDRPQNACVAGFIGSPAMNLIAGDVADGRVQLPGVVVPVDSAAMGPVIFGIRPEHLELVPLGTMGAMTGQVTRLESTGTATFVAVQTAGFRLDALFSDRLILARGDVIALRARGARHHLFDQKTLLRLT